MSRRARGHAAVEYLLAVAVVVTALCVPWVDGLSISSLLARRIVDAMHGLFLLVAQS